MCKKRDHSILANIAFNIILTITLAFLFAKFGSSQELSLSIISAITISIYVFIMQLYFFYQKIHDKSFQQVINIIEIDNNFHDDTWSYKLLKRISIITGSNNRSAPVYRELIEESIESAIKDSEELVASGKKIDFIGTNEEFERQKWLIKFIKHSEKNVKAETSFDTKYWANFWDKKFADEYIKTNTDAAKNGVEIHRIFVLPIKVLMNQDEHICPIIANIIRPMLKLHPKLKVSCAAIEDLKEASDFEKKNFLIVDDKYASVSEDFSEDPKGNVVVGKREEINTLTKLFEILEKISKPANTYKFITQ